MTGRNGSDLYITVPVGTVVTELDQSAKYMDEELDEVEEEGEEELEASAEEEEEVGDGTEEVFLSLCIQ